MAYNVQRIKFSNNEIQYRFYKTPVIVKGEPTFLEKDEKAEKLFIEKNAKRIVTPFGDVKNNNNDIGTLVDDITVKSQEQVLIDKARSIASATNRSKQKVYEYARSNEWEWFITLTFNKAKIDRFDYTLCSRTVMKWLNNIRSKYAPNLMYLLVPELHKGDGSERNENGDYAWHFHGLLANIGSMKMIEATYKKNKGTHKKGDLWLSDNGLQVYNFGNYKLGFSTATRVQDTSKASNYITKYITKDLTSHTFGHRRYYPSKNLQLAVTFGRMKKK